MVLTWCLPGYPNLPRAQCPVTVQDAEINDVTKGDSGSGDHHRRIMCEDETSDTRDEILCRWRKR